MSKTKEIVLVIFLLLVLAGLIYAARILFLRAKEIQHQGAQLQVTAALPQKKEPTMPSAEQKKVVEFLTKDFKRPLPIVLSESPAVVTDLPTWASDLFVRSQLEPVTEKRLTKAVFADSNTGFKLYFKKTMDTDISQVTYLLRGRFETKTNHEYIVNFKNTNTNAAVEVQRSDHEGMYLVYDLDPNNKQIISGYALFW